MFRQITIILTILTLLLSTSPVQALICDLNVEACEMPKSDVCVDDAGLHPVHDTMGAREDNRMHAADNGCCCTIRSSETADSATAFPLLPGSDQTKISVGRVAVIEAPDLQSSLSISLNRDDTSQAFPPKLYRLYASYLI
jgi:hypothetical protein